MGCLGGDLFWTECEIFIRHSQTKTRQHPPDERWQMKPDFWGISWLLLGQGCVCMCVCVWGGGVTDSDGN